MPVSPQRLAERGFNQAERLAAGLAQRTGISSLPLLERLQEMGKMSAKTRWDRLKAAQLLFTAAPQAEHMLQSISAHAPSRPLNLLIVDDIYTTGGTMDGCARALQQITPVPLDIYGLTWARA